MDGRLSNHSISSELGIDSLDMSKSSLFSNPENLTEQQIIEILETIFPNNAGFDVRCSQEGVFRIETDEHEGFNEYQIKSVFKRTNLYLSQIFCGNSGNMGGQTMTLLDLNKVDTHTAFYGYKQGAAQGSCYICGKQIAVCGHKYARATSSIRNCHVCEWHEFCKSCNKETHGGDMCKGDLCITCYRKEHGND